MEFGTRGIPYWWTKELEQAQPCSCPDTVPVDRINSETCYSDFFFEHFRCRGCGKEWGKYLEG